MAQESAERLMDPDQKSACADHPDQRSFSSVSSSRVHSQGHRQTSSVLTATNSARNQAIYPQVSCAFCNGGHSADQCTRFKTVVERKSTICPNRFFSLLTSGPFNPNMSRHKKVLLLRKSIRTTAVYAIQNFHLSNDSKLKLQHQPWRFHTTPPRR